MEKCGRKSAPCDMRDHGKQPFVANMCRLTETNPHFRAAIWTGEHLQVTLMCIPVGGEIGCECHPHTDQFLRIESGCAQVLMGKNRNELRENCKIGDDYAVFIPAGTWHNIINSGCTPLKLYSVYAPPQHPCGTMHHTKEDADKAEQH